MKHTMLILLSASLLAGCSGPTDSSVDPLAGGGGAIPMPPTGSYEWALGLAEDVVGPYDSVKEVWGVKINSSGCIEPNSDGRWFIYFDLGSEGYEVRINEDGEVYEEEWVYYEFYEDLEFIPDNETISTFLSLHYDFGGTDNSVQIRIRDMFGNPTNPPEEMLIESHGGDDLIRLLWY